MQPERHGAAAAIAVGLWPQDALLFAIAAYVPRSHLRLSQTIVRDRAAVFRP